MQRDRAAKERSTPRGAATLWPARKLAAILAFAIGACGAKTGLSEDECEGRCVEDGVFCNGVTR